MNNPMEWSDLRIFLAISRTRTLLGAARMLNSSQPTVGRRIQALEAALGHKLFQRTASGFMLTDEGEQVLHHAEQIENNIHAMERNLIGREQMLSGHLKVSSSDWFGIHVLSEYIAEFSKINPNITVELNTDFRQLNLQKREADIVFRIIPFKDPDIVQRKVLTMNYALYANKEMKIDLTKKEQTLNIITMDGQFSEMPDSIWLRKKLSHANVVFMSNSRQAQAQYCLTSDAIAVLPTALGDSFHGLHRVKLDETLPQRNVWLGYHKDLRQLSRLRAFIDYVSEKLSSDTRFIS